MNTWLRRGVWTLRHGVKRNRRAAIIMPSEDYNRLVDADVSAIIAYASQLAPLPGAAGEVRLPMPLKALYGAGFIQDASEKIDHSLPPATPVPEGVTDAPPDWPPAAQLASGPGSALDRYATAEQFAAMFKTGKRPDGAP